MVYRATEVHHHHQGHHIETPPRHEFLRGSFPGDGGGSEGGGGNDGRSNDLFHGGRGTDGGGNNSVGKSITGPLEVMKRLPILPTHPDSISFHSTLPRRSLTRCLTPRKGTLPAFPVSLAPTRSSR